MANRCNCYLTMGGPTSWEAWSPMLGNAIIVAACVLFVARGLVRAHSWGFRVRWFGWQIVKPEWVSVFDRDASPLRSIRVPLARGWVAYKRTMEQL